MIYCLMWMPAILPRVRRFAKDSHGRLSNEWKINDKTLCKWHKTHLQWSSLYIIFKKTLKTHTTNTNTDQSFHYWHQRGTAIVRLLWLIDLVTCLRARCEISMFEITQNRYQIDFPPRDIYSLNYENMCCLIFQSSSVHHLSTHWMGSCWWRVMITS